MIAIYLGLMFILFSGFFIDSGPLPHDDWKMCKPQCNEPGCVETIVAGPYTEINLQEEDFR